MDVITVNAQDISEAYLGLGRLQMLLWQHREALGRYIEDEWVFHHVVDPCGLSPWLIEQVVRRLVDRAVAHGQAAVR